GLVLGVELRLRALDVRLPRPPRGVDRLLEIRAGYGRPRRLQARLHRVRALQVDVDVTLLVRGDARDEALPTVPDVGRQVLRRLVAWQRDHEVERDRQRRKDAGDRADVHVARVQLPIRGREADRALTARLDEAVGVDGREDRLRRRPAHRVVTGGDARL